MYQFAWRNGALEPAEKDSGYIVLADSAEQARRVLARHRGGIDAREIPAPEGIGDVFYYESERQRD